jgi:hypothetical protein
MQYANIIEDVNKTPHTPKVRLKFAILIMKYPGKRKLFHSSDRHGDNAIKFNKINPIFAHYFSI